MCENCLTVVGLGCICCCEFRCNLQGMRNALAFLPPRPSSYVVQQGSNDETKGKIVYIEKRLQESVQYQRAASCAEVSWVEPRRGCQVPVVWLRRQSWQPKADAEPPLVLLHCHGNATDLGLMMGHYLELVQALGVDVVGVEYTGYGAAGGRLNTKHVASDIEAAYELITSSGVPPGRIVAYGQSVGSAPAVHLASVRRLGGLVLHSPLASGLRVIDRNPNDCCRPSCAIACFDIFRNDRKITAVSCPVLIMHGQCDEVVPIHNAQLLHRKCSESSRRPPYFVPKAGHNDIVEINTEAYFRRLRGFFSELQQGAAPAGGFAACLGKPRQLEMQPEGQKAVGEAPATVVEPKVGPTDGRYEHLRHGGGLSGAARAAAS